VSFLDKIDENLMKILGFDPRWLRAPDAAQRESAAPLIRGLYEESTGISRSHA
jgi:hypothetical protein